MINIGNKKKWWECDNPDCIPHYAIESSQLRHFPQNSDTPNAIYKHYFEQIIACLEQTY